MNWWWSIEKNMERITIQRSRDIESVRDMYQREKRTTGPSPWTWIRKIKTTQGRNTTINELINYIWRKDVLNKGYHVLSANCQEFAALLFDRINLFHDRVYFDEAADQPRSSANSCYMTVDKVLDEVQRYGGSETLIKLKIYKANILFKNYVGHEYPRIKAFPLLSETTCAMLILTFLFYILLSEVNGFTETSTLIILLVLWLSYFIAVVLVYVSALSLQWCRGGKYHIVMIFETKEGTYWSSEQLKTRLVIHRAKNKDVLLNECQRHPRCIPLKESKTAVRTYWNDMNEVMEYFFKDKKNKNDVFQSVVDVNVISSLYNKSKRITPRREIVDV
ncbi:hypothetical protein GHT06_005423 [Daphnia sinensis]|uniref:Uncharacterized protein n=1 Tax=Daphnia sinensis TaxID=1820382 RepID=A0AAD5KF07_9CRUS|nr:hypothetical protein GHT06_005464 [Daphnia sinensis]KAI9550617.1 hypothetical protein GHT06_005423 [Daphnia sinensis]